MCEIKVDAALGQAQVGLEGVFRRHRPNPRGGQLPGRRCSMIPPLREQRLAVMSARAPRPVLLARPGVAEVALASRLEVEGKKKKMV